MARLHKLKKRRAGTQDASAPREEVTRFTADLNTGLSAEQVQERIEQNLQNFDATPKVRSERQIVLRNICTLFNLINILFFIAIAAVGSWKDTLFMAIVAANILIGIVQEIRAKRAVDSLSFMTASKAKVVRDGVETEIPIEEIVLDDIILLGAGDQVPTDSVIVSGSCEADESFLTGESDGVSKNTEDSLLAGSFIISGSVRVRAEHLGDGNYISKISSSAKKIDKQINSEIMRTMQTIVAVVSVALIPISIILFRNQLALPDATVRSAVLNTTAALIAMVPEGLILLTSTILAASVARLSRRKVMVQELYCIETLARVDILCLDKTGTITEGVMTCEETVVLDDSIGEDIPRALASLTAATEDRNATFSAIAAAYRDAQTWSASNTAAFSSRTKWSGAEFPEHGTYILGAAECVLPSADAGLLEKIAGYSENYRVLLLCRSDAPLPEEGVPDGLTPAALILLQDTIRSDAPDTLRYFKEQGVVCKVISGDSVGTVSSIARRAGVEHWEKAVDMTKVAEREIADAAERYTIFGRVSPEQKKALICALQANGHTVAMTGDGVNDVMALKEADCGISIADGAEAARNVAQLVLLKSNFDALPDVVAEGRRAINNIQRSASLYLVKTVYASLLSIIFLFLTAPYPFEPIHLTLIGLATTGIPSIVLGLQPNSELVQGRFLRNVLTTAAPCGITIAVAVLMAVISGQIFALEQSQISALCVLFTGGATLLLLFHICHPWTPVRVTLFASMTALFCIGYFGMNDFFSIERFEVPALLLLLLLGMGSYEIFRLLWRLFHSGIETRFYRAPAEYVQANAVPCEERNGSEKQIL